MDNTCPLCKEIHNDSTTCDYEACSSCGFDHQYENQEANAYHFNQLANRVANGFLFFAPTDCDCCSTMRSNTAEKLIRDQLKNEGFNTTLINMAIEKGRKIAQEKEK